MKRKQQLLDDALFDLLLDDVLEDVIGGIDVDSGMIKEGYCRKCGGTIFYMIEDGSYLCLNCNWPENW